MNVATIFRRELFGYFGQPLAYIVLTLFTLLLALPSLWFQDVLLAGKASLRTPFFWTAVAFLFVVPAITMRALAEERRTKTLEILGTLPLRAGEIVAGKWLAAVGIVAVALLLTLSYPVAMSLLGELDWGPVVGGYLGLLLVGAAFAAVGVAASALTQFQILAFLVSLSVCLVPWALGFLLPFVPPELVGWVQYATFEYHFANLARGVLDTRSLVFFASVIVVALRVAVLTLEHRRLS